MAREGSKAHYCEPLGGKATQCAYPSPEMHVWRTSQKHQTASVGARFAYRSSEKRRDLCTVRQKIVQDKLPGT